MEKESIGVVTCPHCLGDAAVYETRGTKGLRYYRCGAVMSGFSTGCGTVQVYGVSGQAWISAQLNQGVLRAASDPVPDPVPVVVADPMPDPVRPQGRVINQFLKELTTL